jgi:phosphohistidine phosphatase SixA
MPYLVRHAHAGSKRTWPGPDETRPLSATGRREVNGLLTRLRDHPVGRILTSPALRCQQTVVPLGQRRSIPIEVTDRLGIGAPVDGLRELVVDPSLQTAVLCGHGELIGQLLRQLVADGLELDAPLHWEKGSTWVLDTADWRVTAARYLAPLQVEELSRQD